MRFIRRFGTYFPYSTNRVILEESMLISDVMYHTPGEPGAFDVDSLLVGTSVSFIQV